MSETPLVSIILPTHNGERYLREALESCLAQTYPNWELIAVDDCSTDSTPAILQAYAARDRRIRVIRNVTNLKLPRSLNVGFASAAGEILTWTSDDNNYVPEALATMVAELVAHPEVTLVYADQEFIDDNGQLLSYQVAGAPEQLCYFNVINACFAYRRRVWEELGGYDDAVRLVEDWEYWLRVACRFELRPIRQRLYQYRQHAQTLTMRQGEQRWLVVERVLVRYLPRLRSRWPRAAVRGYLFLCNERWRHDDRITAWRHLRRALGGPGAAEVIRHWRSLLPLCLGKRVYYGLAARVPRLRIEAPAAT